MIKILIIAAADLPIPAYKGGATETLTEKLLAIDENIDNDFMITVYSRCNYKNFSTGKVDYRYLPKTNRDRLTFKFFWLIRQLTFRKAPIPDFFPIQISRDININDFDVVILEGNKDQVLPLRKKFKGKIVLHIHTVMTFTEKIMFSKKVFNECDAIIANSEFSKKVMSKINPARAEKIKVLLNAVDISEYIVPNNFFRNDYRKKLGVNENDFLVLFAGRLEPGKGILELLKAYNRCRIPGKLIIVGSGWYSNNYETEYIKQLKKEAESIRDKIVFTGYIEHKEMPAYYHSCDVAIMPSIYDEAAGLVAIEAQASGLPVIISDIGGIPEYVDRETLLKIPVDSMFIDNLSKMMMEIYNNKSLYKREVELSKRSCERFDMTRYRKEFFDIVRNVYAE